MLPTIAKWTNAKLPENRALDGQDISELLITNGKADERKFNHRPIYIVNANGLEAVKDGAWKYREVVEAGKSGEPKKLLKELFNLNFDPSERYNVIDKYPEKANQMKALFDVFEGNKEN